MAVETGIGSVGGYEEGFGVKGSQALIEYGEALTQYRQDIAEKIGVPIEELHDMAADEIGDRLKQVS